MGKWSSLKGQLPALPGESPEWMEKVRAKKDEIAADLRSQDLPISLANLTHLYNEVREEKDRLAEEEKMLNIHDEALKQLIVEALEASGSDIWRGNGHSFSEKVEPYASVDNRLAVVEHFVPLSEIEECVITGDAAAARELIDKARQGLAHVNVPWQTLNSLVKAEAEAGLLSIEEKQSIDPVTGETVMTTEVRPTIPGVKVFLKSSINRRKSNS